MITRNFRFAYKALEEQITNLVQRHYETQGYCDVVEIKEYLNGLVQHLGEMDLAVCAEKNKELLKTEKLEITDEGYFDSEEHERGCEMADDYCKNN